MAALVIFIIWLVVVIGIWATYLFDGEGMM